MVHKRQDFNKNKGAIRKKICDMHGYRDGKILGHYWAGSN